MVNYEFEVNIRITDEGIDVVDKREDGTVAYKRVELQELLKVLDLSSEKSEILTVDSKQLPKNCIRVFSHVSEKATSNGYFLYVEEGNFDITYYKDVFKDFHMPNLLFYFSINKNKIVKSKVFAVKDKIDEITDDTILYRYPFGNVFTGGNICWGTNVLPKITSPLQLKGIPYMFINSPTVDDLYPKYKDMTQRELLMDLQNKKFGVYDILQEDTTYEKFIKGLMRNY